MSPAELRDAAADALDAAIQRQGLDANGPGPSVVARIVGLVYPHAGEVVADDPAA